MIRPNNLKGNDVVMIIPYLTVKVQLRSLEKDNAALASFSNICLKTVVLAPEKQRNNGNYEDETIASNGDLLAKRADAARKLIFHREKS